MKLGAAEVKAKLKKKLIVKEFMACIIVIITVTIVLTSSATKAV